MSPEVFVTTKVTGMGSDTQVSTQRNHPSDRDLSMAPQATFDMGDELTPEQKKEQLSVMKQGEQIIQAQQEDKQRQIDDAAARADEIDLIDGKFKTQEDLLKAYKELEKKLGSGEPVGQEEPVEEPVENLRHSLMGCSVPV